MNRIFPMLALLAGCSLFSRAPCPAHGASTPPVSEVTLRATWASRFGALPSPACDAHWAWSVVTPAVMDRYYCDSVVNAGCTTYFEGCPLTVTTQEYAADTLLAAHEYAHWALHCSKGNGDPQHTNVAVWGAGGFVPSFAK
jgi:hypothetical protein